MLKTHHHTPSPALPHQLGCEQGYQTTEHDIAECHLQSQPYLACEVQWCDITEPKSGEGDDAEIVRGETVYHFCTRMVFHYGIDGDQYLFRPVRQPRPDFIFCKNCPESQSEANRPSRPWPDRSATIAGDFPPKMPPEVGFLKFLKVVQVPYVANRSEERRVGKEC